MANRSRRRLERGRESAVRRIERTRNLGLKGLTVAGAVLESLPSFDGLSQLTSLNLARSSIEDISEVAKLQNLERIMLPDAVDDIRPLQKLRGLKVLNARAVSPEEARVISSLLSLEEVFLLGAVVESLDFLADLRRLKSIYIVGGTYHDLSPLSGLRELRNLSINHAPVRDLSPLRDLSKLRSLDCSGTLVDDLGPLEDFVSVNHLMLRSTPVRNLRPIANMTSLKTLGLAGSNVSNIAQLVKLRRLEHLNLSDTKIKNLSGLEKLERLRYLDVSRTAVTELSPLATLLSLGHATLKKSHQGLSYSECPIADKQLREYAGWSNPKRTIYAIEHLRMLAGLPPAFDQQVAEFEREAGLENDQDAPPELSEIPNADRSAIEFRSSLQGPIDLLPFIEDRESLAGGANRTEDYLELRAKAEALAALGENRLGQLAGSLARFVLLPEDLRNVRAKLFWSRVNTLRITLNVHDSASVNNSTQVNEHLLDDVVAAGLRDLVETANVFAVGDPVLLELDALRLGPQEGARADEEITLALPTVNALLNRDDLVTANAREVLADLASLRVGQESGGYPHRLQKDFARRTIRNLIGELLRRAYRPLRTAWKGVRDGAYHAAGAATVGFIFSEIAGFTAYHKPFIDFVALHVSALLNYTKSAFQNPAVQEIIKFIVGGAL